MYQRPQMVLWVEGIPQGFYARGPGAQSWRPRRKKKKALATEYPVSPSHCPAQASQRLRVEHLQVSCGPASPATGALRTHPWSFLTVLSVRGQK
jgi:hypothetical protein